MSYRIANRLMLGIASIVLICASLIGNSDPGRAASIGFEDVGTGTCAVLGDAGVTSNGFNFVAGSGDLSLFGCSAGAIGNNTSNALIDANLKSVLIMTNNDGEAFSLESFFAGSRTAFFDTTSVDDTYGLATGIDVLGNLTNGGSVFQHFDFSFLDWDQFILDDIFNQSLSSVVFTAVGSGTAPEFLIDDIVVNAVPLPAGVWLLLSALGGLGLAGWRRKWAEG